MKIPEENITCIKCGWTRAKEHFKGNPLDICEFCASTKEDELPGMLALGEGVREQRWPHTMDARVWTQEWLNRVKENPSIAMDEGAMIGWFANAIMAGYDTARARLSR